METTMEYTHTFLLTSATELSVSDGDFDKNQDGPPYSFKIWNVLLFSFLITNVWSFNCNIGTKAVNTQFTLSAGRNSSGHWDVEIDLIADVNGLGDNPMETNHWGLVTDFGSHECQNGEVIHIQNKLKVPSSSLQKVSKESDGYTYFPGLGYYKHHGMIRKWEDAKRTCENEGAYVAIINSANEVNALRKLHHNTPRTTGFGDWPDYIYIGVLWVSNGRFLTLKGDTLQSTGYVHWGSGNPANNANEKCLSLHVEAGKLYDGSCNDVLFFVCEKDL